MDGKLVSDRCDSLGIGNFPWDLGRWIEGLARPQQDLGAW
jgi:hypothetical protein